MKILVACEESQAVTVELRKLGHDAYSCDIEPCSGGHPEWHIQDDALRYINGVMGFRTSDGISHEWLGGQRMYPVKWDMIIAFPPCTYLSCAGNRWLWADGQLNTGRYLHGVQAKQFFMTILNADCPRVAVENPIHAKIYDMPPFTQAIQPYMFGHAVTKATRLWLKNLPLLMATDIVIPERCFMPSSKSGENGYAKHNSKARSKTFPGVARAMAQQWAGQA